VLWVFALVCCSKEKIAKLAELINKTNMQEMRWIIMIILKGEPAMTKLLEFHSLKSIWQNPKHSGFSYIVCALDVSTGCHN
jgi:hypothetical protein